MKKQIFGMALIGLLASVNYANAWSVDFTQFDNYGTASNGSGKFVIAPDSDFPSQGTSTVFGADGTTHVGFGTYGTADSTANWDVSSALTSTGINSFLQITGWAGTSGTGWGWADCGWLFIPNAPLTLPSGATWISAASSAGLASTQTLNFTLSYDAGKVLTVQFLGSATAVYDNSSSTDSPPRATITGSGSSQVYSVPVSNVKKASWVSATAAKWSLDSVTVVALYRIVAAGTSGAAFPTAEPKQTHLQVTAATNGGTIAVESNANVSLALSNDNITVSGLDHAVNASLVNSLGQVVRTAELSSASNSMNVAGIEKGVYFFRTADMVRTVTIH